MKTRRLEGISIRDHKKEALIEEIQTFDTKPCLAILQVGKIEDSTIYIRQKKKFGESIGVGVSLFQFPETVQEQELIEVIQKLNTQKEITGIILQVPIPKHLDPIRIINTIDPQKDVDGLTDVNQLKLEKGEKGIVPATARGIFSLLDYYNISVSGKKVVVLGRSCLVGKPVALLAQAREAIVHVCHSQTKNTQEIAKTADILISATGVAGLVTKDFVQDGAVVIDVGINLVTGEALEEEVPQKTFVGDVLYDDVFPHVSAMTPVPGGVGPMTVVSLFENLVDAYKMQKSQESV